MPTPSSLSSNGLVKKTLAEKLLAEIMNGTLPPGTRIIEGKWAQHFGVAQGTIREAINLLERDGFVTRKHDSGDRRMMLVHLTPKGHSAIQEILPGHFKQMAAQMAPLSEHERKTLVRLLNKLAGDPAASHIESRGHHAVETA